ncbi:MAG: O-antigen ligase family protein, partial [Verrucomicrobia bacterium]|nr:O-antigen ligase family protein [Verrucomicrobiota bacterium]
MQRNSISRIFLYIAIAVYPLFIIPDIQFSNSTSKFVFLSLLSIVVSSIACYRFFPEAIFKLKQGRNPLILVILAVVFVYIFLVLDFNIFSISLLFECIALILILNTRQIGDWHIPKPVIQVATLIIAWSVIEVFFSINQYTSLFGQGHRRTGFITIAHAGLIFFLVIRTVRDEKRFNALLNAVALSGGVVCVFGLLEYFGLDVFPFSITGYRHGLRSCATMGNPNWFASYLVLIIVPSVFLYLKTGRIHHLFLTVLIYSNILTALTRGAWLAFFVFICILFFGLRTNRLRLMHLICLFGITTMILMPVNDWRLVKRFGSIADEYELLLEGDDRAGSKRLEIWKWAAGQIPSHLALGSGFDTIDDLGNNTEQLPSSKTHNILLEYLITTGLPGTILYFAFLWLCLWKYPLGESRFFAHVFFIVYIVQGMF